jgi:hypothetical protein
VKRPPWYRAAFAPTLAIRVRSGESAPEVGFTRLIRLGANQFRAKKSPSRGPLQVAGRGSAGPAPTSAARPRMASTYRLPRR